jgi:acyl-CoA thioester hydrolase
MLYVSAGEPNRIPIAVTLMTAPFRYYLRVRYNECDAQKVVFNVQYGNYIDLAVFEFLRALGYGEAMSEGDLDYQLVKQTLEWKSSARFDQVLEISVWTETVGNTSFAMTTQFRVAGQPSVIATGQTIYVLVDARTLTKLIIAPELRAALELGAANRWTDHAGYLPPDRCETPPMSASKDTHTRRVI